MAGLSPNGWIDDDYQELGARYHGSEEYGQDLVDNLPAVRAALAG